jgi:hypothetical protein
MVLCVRVAATRWDGGFELVSMANCWSGSDRKLNQAVAVALPAVIDQIGQRRRLTRSANDGAEPPDFSAGVFPPTPYCPEIRGWAPDRRGAASRDWSEQMLLGRISL